MRCAFRFIVFLREYTHLSIRYNALLAQLCLWRFSSFRALAARSPGGLKIFVLRDLCLSASIEVSRLFRDYGSYCNV